MEHEVSSRKERSRNESSPSEDSPKEVSPVARWILVACGTICVGLAAVGIFLPVLPTTPFLLLAAACYVRSSSRMYRWLLESRAFGPLILQWRRDRTIPVRAKVGAIVLVVVCFAVSIAFTVNSTAARVTLALVGLALAGFLACLPTSRPSTPLPPEDHHSV